jgi:flagellar capping protein FliD
MVDSRDKEIENLKNQLAELKSTLSKREEEYTRKFEFLSITSKQEK